MATELGATASTDWDLVARALRNRAGIAVDVTNRQTRSTETKGTAPRGTATRSMETRKTETERTETEKTETERTGDSEVPLP
jgi:hypothetical protein